MRNHHIASEHPWIAARADARARWNAEIDKLTKAALRDEQRKRPTGRRLYVTA